jgi:hypothetical protein
MIIGSYCNGQILSRNDVVQEKLAFYTSQGYSTVKLDGGWGLIDPTGTKVIQINKEEFDREEYMIILADDDTASVREKYLHRVCWNDKWGFMNDTGKVVVPCKYERLWLFSEEVAAVYLNGKWGYLDVNGKEITPCKYDDFNSFSEGLAAVKLHGKWGYIDKTGKAAIPFRYDGAKSFSEGLARVELNDKWGYINKTDKAVIPLKYDEVNDFSEGLARVKLNGEWFTIDLTGQCVKDCP